MCVGRNRVSDNLVSRAIAIYGQSVVNTLRMILILHGQSPLLHLEHFLRDNWELVEGSVCCYTALPTDPATTLCCSVAEYVAKTKNVSPIELLMPTINKKSYSPEFPQLGLDQSGQQLPLHAVLRTHILSDDMKSLIPVRLVQSAITESDIDEAQIINPYSKKCLTENEKYRLFHHSKTVEKLIDTRRKIVNVELLIRIRQNYLGLSFQQQDALIYQLEKNIWEGNSNKSYNPGKIFSLDGNDRLNAERHYNQLLKFIPSVSQLEASCAKLVVLLEKMKALLTRQMSNLKTYDGCDRLFLKQNIIDRYQLDDNFGQAFWGEYADYAPELIQRYYEIGREKWPLISGRLPTIEEARKLTPEQFAVFCKICISCQAFYTWRRDERIDRVSKQIAILFNTLSVAHCLALFDRLINVVDQINIFTPTIWLILLKRLPEPKRFAIATQLPKNTPGESCYATDSILYAFANNERTWNEYGMKLFELLPVSDYYLALISRTRNGETAMHCVVLMPSITAKILDKLTKEQFLSALTIRNDDSCTPLHNLAKYAPEKLSDILSKLSDTERTSVFSLCDDERKTILHLLADNRRIDCFNYVAEWWRSGLTFSHLMQQNLCKQSFLHIAAYWSPAQCSQFLLNLFIQNPALAMEALTVEDSDGNTIVHILSIPNHKSRFGYESSSDAKFIYVSRLLEHMPPCRLLACLIKMNIKRQSILHQFPGEMQPFLSLLPDQDYYAALAHQEAEGNTIMHQWSRIEFCSALLARVPLELREEIICIKNRVGDNVLSSIVGLYHRQSIFSGVGRETVSIFCPLFRVLPSRLRLELFINVPFGQSFLFYFLRMASPTEVDFFHEGLSLMIGFLDRLSEEDQVAVLKFKVRYDVQEPSRFCLTKLCHSLFFAIVRRSAKLFLSLLEKKPHLQCLLENFNDVDEGDGLSSGMNYTIFHYLAANEPSYLSDFIRLLPETKRFKIILQCDAIYNPGLFYSAVNVSVLQLAYRSGQKYVAELLRLLSPAITEEGLEFLETHIQVKEIALNTDSVGVIAQMSAKVNQNVIASNT